MSKTSQVNPHSPQPNHSLTHHTHENLDSKQVNHLPQDQPTSSFDSDLINNPAASVLGFLEEEIFNNDNCVDHEISVSWNWLDGLKSSESVDMSNESPVMQLESGLITTPLELSDETITMDIHPPQDQPETATCSKEDSMELSLPSSFQNEISKTISSDLDAESNDIFQQLLAEFKCGDEGKSENPIDPPPMEIAISGMNHDELGCGVISDICNNGDAINNASMQRPWPTQTVPQIDSSSADILSCLTNDILNPGNIPKSTSYEDAYPNNFEWLMTYNPSLYWGSSHRNIQNGCDHPQTRKAKDNDVAMTFLSAPPPPETAPAIPCLPDSLVERLNKKEVKEGEKFRKSYGRTPSATGAKTQPQTNTGSYIDMIGLEEGESIIQKPFNNLYNEFFAPYDKHELPDAPPPVSKSLSGRQINAKVFKRIKSDIEKDRDNIRNFSGYVEPDTSCLASCLKPASRKVNTESSCDDEINIGTLSSCTKVGQVRKVRMEGGEEVVIISPTPKYRMSMASSRCRVSTPNWSRDPENLEPERLCQTCNKFFKTSRGLITHSLKFHSR